VLTTFDENSIKIKKVLVTTDNELDEEESGRCDTGHIIPDYTDEDDLGAYQESNVSPTIVVNPSSISAIELISKRICEI
jgi:hypothetical protein